MRTTEFCVYNETQENFLSTRATVIDSRSDPLKVVQVLVEGLAVGADTALWLNPISTLQSVPRLSPFDLILLDRDGRVVHGMELIPAARLPRLNGTAESALILPFHTFSTSQTHPGDHVVICPAEELQGRPERFPDPLISTPTPSASNEVVALPRPTSVVSSPVAAHSAELPAPTESVPELPGLKEPIAQKPQNVSFPDSIEIDSPLLHADLSPQYPTLRTPLEHVYPQPAIPKAARFTLPRKELSPLRFLFGLSRLRVRVSVSVSASPAASYRPSAASIDGTHEVRTSTSLKSCDTPPHR